MRRRWGRGVGKPGAGDRGKGANEGLKKIGGWG